MNLTFATPAQVVEFVELGGAVMRVLILLGVLLGMALVLRWFDLRLGLALDVRALVEGRASPQVGLLSRVAKQARRLMNGAEPIWRLRQMFHQERQALRRGGVGIDMMIAVAPLLGLLGTVTGMIETFDVLGLSAGAVSSDALAGGISKALITTEFGLFIAIPGILMSRALRRRQARIVRALYEMEALCASRVTTTTSEVS